MKRVSNLIIAVTLILLMASGCNQTNKVVNRQMRESENNVSTPKFAIYMIKKNDHIKINLDNFNEIELEEEPIITEKDIISYNWNVTNDEYDKKKFWKAIKATNSFTLKDEINVRERMHNQGYDGAGFYDFIVKADNDPVYVGAFFTIATSMSPPENIYVFSDLEFGDKNTKVIKLIDTSDKDLIHDKRIYNVLKSAEILKE